MFEGLHKIVSLDETIVAISTPLGHSGLGVIRMSGGDAERIAALFFKPHSSSVELVHQKSAVGRWLGVNGEELDEVVVTLFRAPQSYTGEDTVEISGHGNPLVLRRIVETVRSAGARLATAGEFTLRAVAHGKMDLVQAEAVRDFIEAQTAEQAKTALRQVEGSLSKRLRSVKDKLVDIVAHLEAGVDFAEDDVDVPDGRSVIESLDPLLAELDGFRESFGYGKILTKGLRLAILGKPNVGKSSLFNRLVCADRAIVTDIPGTTRDVLTETVNVNGVPLRIADTAGIRETSDRVEIAGVERTFETLAEADLAIAVLDGSAPADLSDGQILQKLTGVRHIVVINKSDLPQRIDPSFLNGSPRVTLSARTGEGFDRLLSELQAFLLSHKTDLADDLVLTTERQYEAIGKTSAALAAAREALQSHVPHEMVLLDLYRALAALGELTGEVVTDDILDRIFSTFCVGK
jgi:tRNA modification GTPase